MDPVQDFAELLLSKLGLQLELDIGDLLDAARDVAHTVARPATPVATYILGYAVASGAAPAQITETLRAALAEWATAHPHAR